MVEKMIGIDIVDLRRIHLSDSSINTMLTEEEKKEYSLKISDRRKVEYLAGRFAVKEAIFKATQDKAYLQYSILNTDFGKPYVLNHPEIEISISHDGDYAIGMAFIREEE